MISISRRNFRSSVRCSVFRPGVISVPSDPPVSSFHSTFFGLLTSFRTDLFLSSASLFFFSLYSHPLLPCLAWAVSQHTDTSNRTKSRAVSQHTDTSNRTKSRAVSQHTDTSNHTKSRAVSQHTDTSNHTKSRAVSQHTDTSNYTKSRAVSQMTHRDTSKHTKSRAVSQHTDTRKHTEVQICLYNETLRTGLA